MVVLRYVLGIGSIWLTESIIYGQAALIMLAAAWTLREGGHVRVDVFYAERRSAHQGVDRSPGRAAAAAAVHAGAGLVCAALRRALLGDPGALARDQRPPAVFLLKTLIPVFALMMALQGVSQAIRALCVLRPAPVTRP